MSLRLLRLAGRFADLFEKRLKHLERIFSRTGLAERGWEFADLTQYLRTQRMMTVRSKWRPWDRDGE